MAMFSTGGAFMRDLARSRAGKQAAKLLAALRNATRSKAKAFAAFRCPACGSRAVCYEARLGRTKCSRGHITVAKASAAAPIPSARVAPAPAAAPAPVKLEPLPGNVGHVMLQGAIARPPGPGRSAFMFNRDLDELRDRRVRAVVVHVANDGGDIGEAESMARHLGLLSRLGVVSVAHVSNASSAASMVALACDYVVTDPAGRWFLHNPHLGAAPMTPENLAHLDGVRERLEAYYRERTVLGAAELSGVMGTERGTFDAGDTHAKGLTDEVGDGVRALAVAMDAAAGRGLPESNRRLALASRVATPSSASGNVPHGGAPLCRP